MALRAVGGDWEGEDVEFRGVGASPSGRTQVWRVSSPSAPLGLVRWWSPWRQYAFFPEPDTLWERGCLRDVAQFLEDRTAEHRVARKGD